MTVSKSLLLVLALLSCLAGKKSVTAQLRGLAAANRNKVLLCHRTSQGKLETLEVNENAVDAHSSHGDFVGVPCEDLSCSQFCHHQSCQADFLEDEQGRCFCYEDASPTQCGSNAKCNMEKDQCECPNSYDYFFDTNGNCVYSPIPSATPSHLPSSLPSEIPSSAPSASPSDSPSNGPSTFPSASLSASPSAEPSAVPSGEPSAVPSSSPSVEPSNTPSSIPSSSPSSKPSSVPSSSPSTEPSSPSDSCQEITLTEEFCGVSANTNYRLGANQCDGSSTSCCRYIVPDGGLSCTHSLFVGAGAVPVIIDGRGQTLDFSNTVESSCIYVSSSKPITITGGLFIRTRDGLANPNQVRSSIGIRIHYGQVLIEDGMVDIQPANPESPFGGVKVVGTTSGGNKLTIAESGTLVIGPGYDNRYTQEGLDIQDEFVLLGRLVINDIGGGGILLNGLGVPRMTVEAGASAEIAPFSGAPISLTSSTAQLTIRGSVNLSSPRHNGIQTGCRTDSRPTANQTVTIAEGSSLVIDARDNSGVQIGCGQLIVEGADSLQVAARWGVSAIYEHTSFTIEQGASAVFSYNGYRTDNADAGVRLWNGGQAVVHGTLTLNPAVLGTQAPNGIRLRETTIDSVKPRLTVGASGTVTACVPGTDIVRLSPSGVSPTIAGEVVVEAGGKLACDNSETDAGPGEPAASWCTDVCN